MKIVTDLIVKSAHKEYDCDACSLIVDGFGSFDKFIHEFSDDLTFEQTEALVLAKHNNFKILKGDSYRKVFYVDDNGNPVTFRGLIIIEKICQYFDVYEEVATV